MIYFTAHTFNCVCHCIRAMFRVLGMYNFDNRSKQFFKFTMCSSVRSLTDFEVQRLKKIVWIAGPTKIGLKFRKQSDSIEVIRKPQ